MDGTIIQQGFFTSTGADVTLSLRSDVDWIMAYNYTNAATGIQFDGVEFYWQRGFAANDALIKYHALASQALSETVALVGVNNTVVGGFTLVDTSIQAPGAALAITLITATNPAVATLTVANPTLKTGDIVRLTNTTGALQLSGIDWEITVVDPTHFSIPFNLAVAATAGVYRKINFDPIFYPRRRVVSSIISPGNLSQIGTTVPHGYTVGQEVRMSVPAVFGMTQMNGLNGTVVTVLSDTVFEINVDSSAFTPFVFPTAAAVPFTPAEVIPFGEDTSFALQNGQDILADATINQALIGIILAAGPASPAGENGDLIYWRAGKSFNT